MLMRAARSRRHWRRPTAVTAVAVGIAGLVGVAPAQAEPLVRCPSQDLQTAINNAPAGSTLVVFGHCTGTFIITKDLNLTGGAGAVLDANYTAFTVFVGGGARSG